MTPNWFSTFALVLWPMVAFFLYQTRPVNQATVWTILGGWLLLPVGAAIKFEMVPPFDKGSIPNLAAFVGCMLVLGRSPRLWYRFGLPEIFLLMLVISPFITSELNTDQLVYGPMVLPGGTPYDALSAAVSQFIFLIPFFLGRQFLRNSTDAEAILRALVIAGLIYSLPMLFEIRMSPQLHAWVYGYFLGGFEQQIRYDGYRPAVFLGHGLGVAFFAMMTAVSAAAFWRTRTRILQLPAGGITAYLSAMLILCKSLGALVYGAVLVPLVRLTKPRLQVRVAAVLAAIVFCYPLLRAGDFVPTETILNAARLVSEDRAASLKTRLDQEQQLLEHASRRFLFGWGRFGRNRIYDAEQGKDISITDGHWIITIGMYGLFGFVAEFGLLALTVFRAASALRFTQPGRDRVYLAALALLVAINMVELLPNATLSAWTWLVAGALLGRAEALRSARRNSNLVVTNTHSGHTGLIKAKGAQVPATRRGSGEGDRESGLAVRISHDERRPFRGSE
jgi:hypothetical protein